MPPFVFSNNGTHEQTNTGPRSVEIGPLEVARFDFEQPAVFENLEVVRRTFDFCNLQEIETYQVARRTFDVAT